MNAKPDSFARGGIAGPLHDDERHQLSRREVLTTFGPLMAAGLASIVFFGTYAYLFVFGTLLGFNVSSLDGNGPTWPFPVVVVSGIALAVTAPIGVVWALVYSFAIRRSGRARGILRS